jgi:hypothetical protein
MWDRLLWTVEVSRRYWALMLQLRCWTLTTWGFRCPTCRLFILATSFDAVLAVVRVGARGAVLWMLLSLPTAEITTSQKTHVSIAMVTSLTSWSMRHNRSKFYYLHTLRLNSVTSSRANWAYYGRSWKKPVCMTMFSHPWPALALLAQPNPCQAWFLSSSERTLILT